MVTDLSDVAHSYVHRINQYRVLKELRKNKDIVVPKSDEGIGVVVMDNDAYVLFALNQLGSMAFRKCISHGSLTQPLRSDP